MTCGLRPARNYLIGMLPTEVLERGREILDPVLLPHGLQFERGLADVGSGGPFARGGYVRGHGSRWSRSTSVRTPRSSFATVHRSPFGRAATTSSALATSIPITITPSGVDVASASSWTVKGPVRRIMNRSQLGVGMKLELPGAVPEIPVRDINAATAYYQNNLGFTADWGGEELGLAGISKGNCRMFLAKGRSHSGAV
jgi:hypothetical protein